MKRTRQEHSTARKAQQQDNNKDSDDDKSSDDTRPSKQRANNSKSCAGCREVIERIGASANACKEDFLIIFPGQLPIGNLCKKCYGRCYTNRVKRKREEEENEASVGRISRKRRRISSAGPSVVAGLMRQSVYVPSRNQLIDRKRRSGKESDSSSDSSDDDLQTAKRPLLTKRLKKKSVHIQRPVNTTTSNNSKHKKKASYRISDGDDDSADQEVVKKKRFRWPQKLLSLLRTTADQLGPNATAKDVQRIMLAKTSNEDITIERVAKRLSDYKRIKRIKAEQEKKEEEEKESNKTIVSDDDDVILISASDFDEVQHVDNSLKSSSPPENDHPKPQQPQSPQQPQPPQVLSQPKIEECVEWPAVDASPHTQLPTPEKLSNDPDITPIVSTTNTISQMSTATTELLNNCNNVSRLSVFIDFKFIKNISKNNIISAHIPSSIHTHEQLFSEIENVVSRIFGLDVELKRLKRVARDSNGFEVHEDFLNNASYQFYEKERFIAFLAESMI